MFSANAFVIYFAIGAPFGVLAMYVTRGHLLISKTLWIAASWLLWPVAAAKTFLATVLNTRKKQPSAAVDPARQAIDEICKRYQSSIEEVASSRIRRQFSFELQRTYSLANALLDLSVEEHRANMPILEAVEHPFPEIAEKCRGRRLRSQLITHLAESIGVLNDSARAQVIEPPTNLSQELLALFGPELGDRMSFELNDRKAA